jgi:hypothetical protein
MKSEMRTKGTFELLVGFEEYANQACSHFHFSSNSPDGAPYIDIRPLRHKHLHVIDRGSGTRINANRAHSISKYLEIPVGQYLLLAALTGMVYFRALTQNADLRQEDLVHKELGDCLLSRVYTIEEFVLGLESPFVCGDCTWFYRALLAEGEIGDLLNAVSTLRSQRSMKRVLGSVRIQAGPY